MNAQNVQTIELGGRRYVVLPEAEFAALREAAKERQPPPRKRFEPVEPLRLQGEPISQTLIRERR